MVPAALRWPFRFDGRVGRVPFAAVAIAALLSQHVVVALLLTAMATAVPLTPEFAVLPARTLGGLTVLPPWVMLLAVIEGALVTWLLAALASRRTADAGIGGWLAAATIVPVIQIPAVLFLAVVPPADVPAAAATPAPPGDHAALQGIAVGMALTVAMVAVDVLAFGATYGLTAFLVAPFFVGLVTAWVANRDGARGFGRTAGLVALALGLGGLGLLLLAFEGVVCILMAAPLSYVEALIGAALGHALAKRRAHSARQLLSALALLPLGLALEDAFPLSTRFEAVQTVAVAAPPAAVWRAIVAMGTIDAEPGLLFRLGVAYPLGGELIGEGVGAERYGAFSTGIAHEVVSEWQPERRFTVTILRDVPSMRELSPYEHVHAPHADGFFRTHSATFALAPRADGGTDLTERTVHELRLEPVLYWLPMARWVVAQNGARALAHIRARAERLHATGGT